MDAQLKSKWVRALRSGKFKQCRDVLFDSKSGGYCCLGVLTKVAGIKIGVDVSDSCFPGYGWFTRAVGSDYDMLTSMNDEGRTFSEIADRIERDF
jgi:hypothetical protein